ncbi:hypothetical protein O181_095528 [Austropuccinia psidii MF-1]|uniref:Uncharacterized protein n=1 Tax=Austropuccinia psidii MF-1 TaxID=1389203 RepID=A0A9Q3PBB0_9BASI|nr:hypothetical protein [Austropuccinia psidii MF-1]
MSELPEKIPTFILDSNASTSFGIIPPSSNEFSTSVYSFALVGELKIPSLPSIHTPPIIPSWSLLPSRDEVFKDTKDAGKDIAISSIHLFQGDMNLSPLSFHDSLKGKWDEEKNPEEIETVLKVVPSSYHHYLDVFSKIKEDKIPLHCSHDYRIELEGSLPPVGSIYSLSNNDSEKLWAYISDNV